jgi:hypothetical protein
VIPIEELIGIIILRHSEKMIVQLFICSENADAWRTIQQKPRNMIEDRGEQRDDAAQKQKNEKQKSDRCELFHEL